MKKSTCLVLCLFIFSLLTGCADSSDPKNRITPQTTGIKDVIESQMALEDGLKESASDETSSEETSDSTSSPDSQTENTSAAAGGNGIDYDLTILGSDMVYAEIFNMMMMPQEYMGRTIKVSGVFTVYYDESKDKYHFACFVSDAAACCQQGIEFILDGDHSYPSDYPQEGSEITITGVFGTYEEGGETYWALTKAAMG